MRIFGRFPPDVYTQTLISQKKIPCVCSIDDLEFTIKFCPPIIEASYKVQGWDLKALEKRAPCGTGGEYLYSCYGLLTLSDCISENKIISELDFFIESVGWCPILRNQNYATPIILDDIDNL